MLLIKWFIKLLFLNITYSIHHKFDKLIISKNSNFEISPFLYIKNKNWINISFYKNITEDILTKTLKIKCLDKFLLVFYSKNQIKINNVLINVRSKWTNYLKFNTNKIFYSIKNYKEVKNFDFECNLKYLKLSFITDNFEKSKISNIQLYDNDFNYENGEIINFLKPLIFVDLKQENIYTNIFKNKFNSFHGGILNNINRLYSFYDTNYGSNWCITNNNQYIELDKNVLSYMNNELIKNFSFYINFDLIMDFIKNTTINKKTIILLYKIIDDNNHFILEIGVHIDLYKNDKILVRFGNINRLNIYSKLINKNQISSNINLGVKFIHCNINSGSNQKFYIGLKNDSILKKNNNTLIKYQNKNISILSKIFNKNNLSHFIGNNNNDKRISIINYNIKYYINEYGFFSGSIFDEIEKNNGEYYLKIKGTDYDIIINNNNNLDRRFSLNNINKLKKCTKTNCRICDLDDKCMFCNNNYYLDKYNNCVWNFNTNYFVNEYSELIKIKYNLDNDRFKTNKNIKILENKDNNIFNLELKNIIIYWNFKIKSLIKPTILNLKFKNNIKNLNFKSYLTDKTSPLTIFFKDFNSFKEIELELGDNYNINLYSSIRYIDCKNLENEIIYKNINCSNICLQNKKKYYYKSINSKYGRCVTEIEQKYYLDINTNYLLKCPDNCSNCNFDDINKTLVCNTCITGYKLLNNICIFSNRFECSKNTNLNTLFDNTNSDNIKICKEFCNLCKIKDGTICSIINLNFDSCNVSNIKVWEYKKDYSKLNFNNCKSIIDNKCLICNKVYFIYKYNCLKCKNNCLKCSNKYNCWKCSKGYFLKDNTCTLCNTKFPNCLECNGNKCITNSLITILNKTNIIDNCVTYKENKCITCKQGFNLNDNKCECINNNFIKINKCINCNKCVKCIDNNEQTCKNCKKCKNKINFKYIQNKNEIVIYYTKDIIMNKNPLFFSLPTITNYIVIFKSNKVIIRIFENIYKSMLIINKNIIKSSLSGYSANQVITWIDYNFNNKPKYDLKNNSKPLIKYKKNIKYKFTNIDLNSSSVKSVVIYSVRIIQYSEFLVLFMPLIIFLNQSTLIILLNTKFDRNFTNFLKLIKKQNYYLIDDFRVFNNEDYSRAYNKIKKDFKNNMIIGDINIFDINMIIMLIILAIYYLIRFIIKFVDKDITSLWNNIKYIGFTLFQSNLITNYYKTIYYINLFFELKNGYNKIFIGLYINFNIFVIIYYFNIHHFYCKLFINPFFNYKKYYNNLINLFIQFKSKVSRNYNLFMNIIDFFIVLVFMEFKNIFILQILLILLLITLKLLYLNYIYWYYKKKNIKIVTEIIVVILLLNFYILIMLQNYLYGNKNLSNYILLYFIIYNIFIILKIIFINIITVYKIYTKNSKLNLKNLQSKNSIKYLRFNKTSFKFN